MNANRIYAWLLTLALCFANPLLALAGASAKADVDIDVDVIEVPEEILVEPTPQEVHEENLSRKCSSCHTPVNPEVQSKFLNHFQTSRECDTCHLSKSWLPLRLYSHLTPKYRARAGQDSQECLSCHVSNSEYFAR